MIRRHARPGAAPASAVLACGVLVVAGCGGTASFESDTSFGDATADGSGGSVSIQNSSSGAGDLPDALLRSKDAAFEVPFRGTRRVRLYRGRDVLEIVEDVGADGNGAFDVVALEVPQTTHGLDEQTAAVLLDARRGFQYRLRDPRLLDVDLFEQNYHVWTDGTVRVADHDCTRIQVERQVPLPGHPGRYQLDIEPRTGIVLAWKELGEQGLVHGEAEFEDFTIGGTLVGLNPSKSDLRALALDPYASLSDQVGFPVLRPDLAPEGFVLESVELVEHPIAGRWVRFGYTDGFERVRFAHSPTKAPDGTDLYRPTPSRLAVLPYGPWTLGVGRINGIDVLVAGKVPEDHLSQLVQSALH